MLKKRPKLSFAVCRLVGKLHFFYHFGKSPTWALAKRKLNCSAIIQFCRKRLGTGKGWSRFQHHCAPLAQLSVSPYRCLSVVRLQSVPTGCIDIDILYSIILPTCSASSANFPSAQEEGKGKGWHSKTQRQLKQGRRHDGTPCTYMSSIIILCKNQSVT